MLSKLIFLITAAFVFPQSGWSQPVDSNGAHCDRSLEFGSLSETEKAQLLEGKQVSRFHFEPNGYVMGYVMKLSASDPELVMGVYSSADEHAGSNGLGSFFLKSEVQGGTDGMRSNPFQVRYEQDAPWPFTNGSYLVEDVVSGRPAGGYILDSVLKESSSSSFSPKWGDEYLLAIPHGNGTLVIGCHYSIPRTHQWQPTYNNTVKDRLILTGNQLTAWIHRVEKDERRARLYRSRLEFLLHN